MDHALVYALIDEAGDTGTGARSSSLLVVAGVVCTRLEILERVVLQTRKSFGKKLRQVPELKASHTPAKIVGKFLERIAALDVEIYTVIIDKRIGKPPTNPEDWYRDGLIECLEQIARQHKRIEFTLDQRYTNKHHRRALVQAIAARTLLHFVAINEANSQEEKALQVADAVAWGIYQKYAYETDAFYRIIEPKIRKEILVKK